MGYGSSSSHPGTTVVIDDGYNWRQEADTPPTPMPPQAPPTPPNSSVFLDDEEPTDMFDKNGPTTGSGQT